MNTSLDRIREKHKREKHFDVALFPHYCDTCEVLGALAKRDEQVAHLENCVECGEMSPESCFEYQRIIEDADSTGATS